MSQGPLTSSQHYPCGDDYGDGDDGDDDYGARDSNGGDDD